MLTAWRRQNGGLKQAPGADGPVPEGAIWLDLFDPTETERAQVGQALGMELPTRADMEEIEASSRLYAEDGALFMTALVLNRADTGRPEAGVVTFVLARDTLVTIRYIDPQPFRTFAARCDRGNVGAGRAEDVLMALIDVIVDRMADILERVGGEIETLSRALFDIESETYPRTTRDFRAVLRALGGKNDLSGKTRECLVTLGRVLAFLAQALDGKKDIRAHVKTQMRDVQSLQDHASYLGGKLNYLLDATLGLINIDQNNIIKIMSVAAMVFLPPTLIASIYGMNFAFMPELRWGLGYPLSLALMAVSAVVPYLWFKKRGWL